METESFEIISCDIEENEVEIMGIPISNIYFSNESLEENTYYSFVGEKLPQVVMKGVKINKGQNSSFKLDQIGVSKDIASLLGGRKKASLSYCGMSYWGISLLADDRFSANESIYCDEEYLYLVDNVFIEIFDKKTLHRLSTINIGRRKIRVINTSNEKLFVIVNEYIYVFSRHNWRLLKGRQYTAKEPKEILPVFRKNNFFVFEKAIIRIETDTYTEKKYLGGTRSTGAITVDDSHLYQSGYNGIMKIWKLNQDRPFTELRGHKAEYLLNDEIYIYSFKENKINIWSKGRKELRVKGLVGSISAPPAQSKRFLFVPIGQIMLVLEKTTWESVTIETGKVKSVCADNDRIYVLSEDELKIYQEDTHKLISRLERSDQKLRKNERGGYWGVLNDKVYADIFEGMEMHTYRWDIGDWEPKVVHRDEFKFSDRSKSSHVSQIGSHIVFISDKKNTADIVGKMLDTLQFEMPMVIKSSVTRIIEPVLLQTKTDLFHLELIQMTSDLEIPRDFKIRSLDFSSESTMEKEERTEEPVVPELIPSSDEIKEAIDEIESHGVVVKRGYVSEGGSIKYKVKIENHTKYVINNVTINILGYPNDTLKLVSSKERIVQRIEPNGAFRSLQFIFQPTQDCVEGEILATVSYIDHQNEIVTIKVAPQVIRSICDMLEPIEMRLDEVMECIDTMDSGLEEHPLPWNAAVTFSMLSRLVALKNIQVTSSESREVGKQFIGTIRGMAKGKYTDKRIALEIVIVGNIADPKCMMSLKICSDEEDMIPVLITEIMKEIRNLRLSIDKVVTDMDQLLMNAGESLESSKIILASIQELESKQDTNSLLAKKILDLITRKYEEILTKEVNEEAAINETLDLVKMMSEKVLEKKSIRDRLMSGLRKVASEKIEKSAAQVLCGIAKTALLVLTGIPIP
ncbi:MAG: hypothetical protein GF411_16905 [Candidatus Lokiarchaeota archaeon]|nr:hypothetical protein [Candidatus Lokiarchaeota archaeon]